VSSEIHCERCGERLDPDRAVWLELHRDKHTWHQAGELPDDETNQGGFPFGAACARAALAGKGRIRSRAL
jgi:hypothetical protein